MDRQKVLSKSALAMREWRAKNKEKWQAYMKEWRANNKEKMALSQRAYMAKNREEISKKTLAKQHANRGRTRLWWKVATANRRYPGKITIHDLEKVVARDGNTCYWCKKEIDVETRDWTLEHLEPYNSVETLTIACSSCNGSKFHYMGPILECYGAVAARLT